MLHGQIIWQTKEMRSQDRWEWLGNGTLRPDMIVNDKECHECLIIDFAILYGIRVDN